MAPVAVKHQRGLCTRMYINALPMGTVHMRILSLAHDCHCMHLDTAWLQVALASFSFLFSEYVQYSQSQVSNIGELERR